MTLTVPAGKSSGLAWRRALGLAAACAGLAAISLIPLGEVTGPDPNAWIAWAYGLLHGNGVDFGQGPAWKPLPVLITAPLNLVGPDPAATCWLFAVRFGALWCSAMLFVLVRRDGGLVGALVAAILPFTIRPWLNAAVVGESESIALALVLTALVLFLAGRPRPVTVLLTLAGMLRPEIWPLLVLQIAVRHRRREGPVAGDAILAAATLGIAWFALPQLIASGGTPLSMRGGYSMKDATFSTVGSNILGVMPPKAWLFIPLGIAAALLAKRTATALLAIGAGLLIAEIVLLWILHPPISAAGYTPVLRYFAVAGVMLCGVAGTGAGWTIGLPAPGPARWLAAVAVTALVGWSVASSIDGSRSAIDRSIDSGRSSRQAAAAIVAAGGMERLAPCVPLTISNWSAINWSISRRLGIPLAWIGSRRHVPSVALDFTKGGWVLRTVAPDGALRRTVLATNGPWEIVHYVGSTGGCIR